MGSEMCIRDSLTPWARGLRSKPARRARAAAAAAPRRRRRPASPSRAAFGVWAAGPFWLSRASAARRCGGGGLGPWLLCAAALPRFAPAIRTSRVAPATPCCKCWPGCRLSYCCSRALHCASARSRYARETGVASRSVSPQIAIDAKLPMTLAKIARESKNTKINQEMRGEPSRDLLDAPQAVFASPPRLAGSSQRQDELGSQAQI